MIPQGMATEGIEIITLPSLNHRMLLDREIIAGKCNGLEAMKQVIYKILNTERYQYIIYSWNYGIELNDLFGMQVKEAVPIIERRITEALLQDDRITSVENFTFDTTKRHVVAAAFTVNTIFGGLEVTKEVNI